MEPGGEQGGGSEQGRQFLHPGALGELGRNLSVKGAVCPGSAKAAVFICLS